jgi:predicted nucleotidyltransferase
MLEQLRDTLRKYRKSKNLFDIVIYGSAAKGKTHPEDLDIIAIFLAGSLRERLNLIQEMKASLETTVKIDFKQMLLSDFFAPEFSARAGILSEGISLFHDCPFASLLGLRASALFWYDLTNKTHTEKVGLNYLLSGRGKNPGILKELGGERLVAGALKIPISRSIEFEEILKARKVSYKKSIALERWAF